jgi:hypothetical protein
MLYHVKYYVIQLFTALAFNLKDRYVSCIRFLMTAILSYLHQTL